MASIGSSPERSSCCSPKTSARTAEVNAKTKQVAHTTEDAVSDAWITTKVKTSLLYSKNVDGLDIEVDTKNGVVTLSGTVDSNAERDLAVELARQVRGVKKVETTGLRIQA